MQTRSILHCVATALTALLFFTVPARADSLEAGFQNPPDSAKPHTWWHWMNGNVTKEGITLDLEAMKRVGIGGAQIFNVDCGIPDGPVKMMSAEWRELMLHAVREADRLGLELCVHNGAGWSSSGGPWNTPEHAMQRVTTREWNVKGPSHFSEVLAKPPMKLDYYRDIALLAFRTPEGANPKTILRSPRATEEHAQAAVASSLPLVIDNIEAKNGANGKIVAFSQPESAKTAGRVVRQSDIVDLTSQLESNGHLDWQVPAGHWTILRLGYTPTGQKNHPAPNEGRGLECDKFSKEALDSHWAGFVQKLLDDAGPKAGAGKALNQILIDSYEVGGQNWTSAFRTEFIKRRGYDPLLYLPALTGRVVDSPEISERFLWDMRRTIADLFADNYYGHFQELCHQHGLTADFEPYTGPFDSLQCGAKADIPMGEFWVGTEPEPSVKLASSIGHIYGQRIIGAESFTGRPAAAHGRWLDDPYSLKTLGDLVFCQGINRFIFHRYAMQPWADRWPGMTMGQWGTHFDRTSTWWEQGRAWLQYVARSQFLLQQGRFVADAAYYGGESAPVELRAGKPALPSGYAWDAVDAEVLLHHATVKDGCLRLESGIQYRGLILPPSDREMRPAVLRQVRQFVADGLAVVGAPPRISPSLEDYPKCDVEVKQLASELWGNCDGQRITEHAFKSGKVFWGRPMESVFSELGVRPDFEYPPRGGVRLAFIHRRDGESDIYFVSNQRKQSETIDCIFRVTGKTPELWNPETGGIMPAPLWREQGGRTVVTLSLDPAGSMFVVFRGTSQSDHLVAVKAGPRSTSKSPELRIIKAVYGSFAKGQIDVTPWIKSKVEDGASKVMVDRDLAVEDPAPGAAKQLRVEFIDKGAHRTAVAAEGTAFNFTPGIEVVKAVYGVFAAERRPNRVDVTGKLAGKVHHGHLSITAGDTLAGGDPAKHASKELRVDYSLDSEVKHAVVQENETLALPDDAWSGHAARTFDLVSAPDGRTRLLSWAPEKIDFTWASGRKGSLDCSSATAPLAISGPWQLSFPPGWNAPASIALDRLESWTESGDAGVKYFSGTATYFKEMDIPSAFQGPGREIWLDLGAVRNFAEVSVNGQSLGILWKPPFRVNITAVAKPGTNKVEIKVTNLWPNRLIGDEQLAADCEWKEGQLKAWPKWLLAGKSSPNGRVTFTTWHHWKKGDALLESGLLGPVTLRAAEVVELK